MNSKDFAMFAGDTYCVGLAVCVWTQLLQGLSDCTGRSKRDFPCLARTNVFDLGCGYCSIRSTERGGGQVRTGKGVGRRSWGHVVLGPVFGLFWRPC